MSQTRAEGTFEVASFEAIDVPPATAITTAMETGVATMEKRYAGDVDGRSATSASCSATSCLRPTVCVASQR